MIWFVASVGCGWMKYFAPVPPKSPLEKTPKAALLFASPYTP
ncbi:MAG TPA: hypothetical protein VGR31_03130 [Planctomycetota bacterium]|nr:hypothetical protein [Planctomycetota bacterium]